MKFQLELKNERVADEALIADLKRVASALGRASLRYHDYKAKGQYSPNTVTRRFGTWNKALQLAGLTKVRQYRITDEELFRNLEEVWIQLGRQPRREELSKANSRFSSGAYEYRFKTWNAALKAFATYVSDSDSERPTADISNNAGGQKFEARGISDRLRFRVMKRDFFKCKICGRSPATDQTIILHVDHVKPWSKGGKTSEDNLQTLCAKCNLGKGNLE